MSDAELLAFGKQGKGRKMAEPTNDQVIQRARQHLHEQIEKCARRAAQKIVAKFKAGKPSAEGLAKLIAQEFEELNP